jgi:acyl-lipid omega-6 desaturase (Delta-12 desaturase)
MTKTEVVQSSWYRKLSEYEKPSLRKAVGQVLNTFVPYVAVWIMMVWIVRSQASLWLLCPLALVAAGLLVRIFIFQHDCGHGSFFPSKRANRAFGFVCGVLTFTPFDDWKHEHSAHHAAAQNLGRRGIGDIDTMTLDEYKAAPLLRRIQYRFFRCPLVIFVAAPFIQFVFINRFSHKRAGKPERRSVLMTNLALLTLIVLAGVTIGLKTYLMVQVPIIALAAGIGVWLFYVQHQYEEVYWAHHDNWDPIRAALEGSSYYKLPRVLQWFSGNIGLHHIHHLRPRIPNYQLQQCYDEIPELQNVQPLTFLRSLKSLRLHLWDEQSKKLVGFSALRTPCEE